MIPKVIHYCWFGRTPKPKLFDKCYRSWKKYCPDYEIVEWNEDNFNLSECPLYVRQAYEAKKWAFVTDYVRLKVVYDYGGIYLDTDVELIKKIDFLLQYNAYFGFESKRYVATGLGFGAEEKMPILFELLQDYNNIPFVISENEYDTTPCPQRNEKVFIKYGLLPNGSKQIINGSILILSPDYLSPMNYLTGVTKKTKNTVSIHHYAASWHDEKQRKIRKEREKKLRKELVVDFVVHLPNRILKEILGEEKYWKLKKILKRL